MFTMNIEAVTAVTPASDFGHGATDRRAIFSFLQNESLSVGKQK